MVDPLSRRVGKKVAGTLQRGFLWSDRLRVVAELDGSGAVVSRFVYAGRVNVPEYMVKGGSTYRLLTDHLGSVRLVVDAATGALAQRIEYDAWGVVTADTNPGFQLFGFAGGLYDPDTGLVRVGARDYSARIGRWTTKDPVRFRGGTNLYGYTLSDPVNMVDPLGFLGGPPPITGGRDIGFSPLPSVPGSSLAELAGALAALGASAGEIACILSKLGPEAFDPSTDVNSALVLAAAAGGGVSTTLLGAGVTGLGVANVMRGNPAAGGLLIYGGLHTAAGGVASTAATLDAAAKSFSAALAAAKEACGCQ